MKSNPSIAITGHRPNKLGNDYDLTSPLVLAVRRELEELVAARKPREMISGMALGIDTLWAMIALYMNVPLTCALPCRGQELMWPKASQILYHKILSQATKVVYVSETQYNNYCMQKRNIWMVNNCDELIAVWDGSVGGTHNCIEYNLSLKANARPIYHIDPKEIKKIISV